jgi:peroxiredoxin
VVNDRERVTVDIDLDNKQKPFISKGSPASEKLNAFVYESNSKLARIYKGSQRVDSMRKANTPDSVIQVSLKQRELAAIDFKNDVIQILNGSESPALSLFVLGSYQSYASSPTLGLTPFTNQQINEMLEKLATRFPNHTGTAQLRKRFSATAAPATPDRPVLVNNPAPAFSLPDVTGKEVSLSSFKGKYLLIDFWASWCKPCRLENPNVVQAYQQFKNKNFAILGVSLDKDKEAWMKAIKDDNLSWTNVSDLKFWDSMVVPLYHIQGIPYNVLVDPNGVVIAENLRGVELSQKLTQVLK